jgi:type I restriction enzyme S subunit
MRNFDFLEKLLDGVAVEWKALGDLVTLRRGRVMSKEYLADNAGKHPVYSSQTANNGEIGRIETFDFDGEFISWTTDGANAGTVFHRTGKFSITNVCGLIKINDEKNLNYKFLFYWLTTEAQKHVYSGMGNPKLMSHQVEKIQIPIPCPENPKKSLEIQTEIVQILDTFTALTAELTAELTARKKQYNYYRDRLLTFEEGEVEWKTLGDLCVIGDGLHGTPKYDDSGEYYFINGNNLDNGRIVYNDKTKKVDELIFKKYGIVFTVENTVFMSINGTIGSVSFFNNEKIVLGKSVAFFNIKSSELYSRFLFYFLLTEYAKNYFEAQKTGSTIKNLGLKALRTFKIPIPPLSEQVRIASLLDKFDTLTHSISEGLPREIALRQKQFQYYRDLLLAFSKP